MIIKTQQTQPRSANVISKSKVLERRRYEQEERSFNRSQAEEELKYLQEQYASGKKLNPQQIEQLKQSQEYDVEYYDDQKTIKSIKSKPVKYSARWRTGRDDQYDYYYPVQMKFDEKGNLVEKKEYQLDSRSDKGRRDTKPFISKEETYDPYGWKTSERFYKTRDWDNQLVKEYRYESGQLTYKQNWGTNFTPSKPTGTESGTNNPEYKPTINSQFRQKNGGVEYFDPNKGKWISSKLPEKSTGTPIYTATIGGKTYQTSNKEFLEQKQAEYTQEYKSVWEKKYSETTGKIVQKRKQELESQGKQVFIVEQSPKAYSQSLNAFGKETGQSEVDLGNDRVALIVPTKRTQDNPETLSQTIEISLGEKFGKKEPQKETWSLTAPLVEVRPEQKKESIGSALLGGVKGGYDAVMFPFTTVENMYAKERKKFGDKDIVANIGNYGTAMEKAGNEIYSKGGINYIGGVAVGGTGKTIKFVGGALERPLTTATQFAIIHGGIETIAGGIIGTTGKILPEVATKPFFTKAVNVGTTGLLIGGAMTPEILKSDDPVREGLTTGFSFALITGLYKLGSGAKQSLFPEKETVTVTTKTPKTKKVTLEKTVKVGKESNYNIERKPFSEVTGELGKGLKKTYPREMVQQSATESKFVTKAKSGIKKPQVTVTQKAPPSKKVLRDKFDNEAVNKYIDSIEKVKPSSEELLKLSQTNPRGKVTVSTGIGEKGLTKYKYTTVSVGRKDYTSLYNQQESLVVSPKGRTSVVRKISAGGNLQGTYNLKPEINLSKFDRKNVLIAEKPPKVQRGKYYSEGGAEFSDAKTIKIKQQTLGTASESKIVGGRLVKKSFVGGAEGQLTQQAKATPQVTTTAIGTPPTEKFTFKYGTQSDLNRLSSPYNTPNRYVRKMGLTFSGAEKLKPVGREVQKEYKKADLHFVENKPKYVEGSRVEPPIKQVKSAPYEKISKISQSVEPPVVEQIKMQESSASGTFKIERLGKVDALKQKVIQLKDTVVSKIKRTPVEPETQFLKDFRFTVENSEPARRSFIETHKIFFEQKWKPQDYSYKWSKSTPIDTVMDKRTAQLQAQIDKYNPDAQGSGKDALGKAFDYRQNYVAPPETMVDTPIQIGSAQVPKVETSLIPMQEKIGTSVLNTLQYRTPVSEINLGSVVAIKSLNVGKSNIKTEQTPFSVTRSEIKSDTKTDIKTGTKVKSDILSKVKTDVISKVDTKVNIKVDTKTETKVDTKVETKVDTKVDTKIETKVKTPTRVLTPTRVKIPDRTEIEYPTPKFGGESQKKSGGFQVFVKSKGRFGLVGTFDNPREAILKGKSIVQKTASASFKVEGPRPDIERSAMQLLPRNIFTRSKKDSEVFVQRREERISSGGELAEITFKGLNVLKQQKGRRNLNRFNIFGR